MSDGRGFANAKVLLLGEHAVVHGEPALAAGLDVGVDARAARGDARLRCEAWDLDVAPDDGSRVGAAYAALLDALPATIKGADVALTPSVPAGAGMGSSAAMAVAAARALAALAGVEVSVDVLDDAALASERVFHGDPSGLDHAVAIRGGLVRFVRGQPATISPVDVGAPLRLIVAQIEPGADTGEMVAAVTRQRERVAAAKTTHIAIGQLVEAAQRAIGAGDIETLGELMNFNHHLLGAVGVSTPALDAACHVAREAGALGAKLTGAGGGGCIIALVDGGRAAAVADALTPHARFVLDARVGRRLDP